MSREGAAPREDEPIHKPVRARRAGGANATIGGFRAWKLEEAKAKFSEVVRRARREGPQRVTYRGEDAVVVIAVDDLRKLLPAEGRRQSLVEFRRASALGDVEIVRGRDRGRDVAL